MKPKAGPIRIAHLYSPQLDVGGVEQHIESLVSSKQDAFNWFVIAPTSNAYRDRLRKGNVDVSDWRPRSVWDPFGLSKLVGLIRRKRIALLHIHGPETLVLGKLAASACRIPVVVTVHLRPEEYFRGSGLLATIKRRFYLVVDSILNTLLTPYTIYVSENDRDQDKRLGRPKRALVIRNGFDVEKFRNARRRRANIRRSLGVSASSLVVSFVGRLDPQKGVDILLNAFQEFVPEHPGSFLWLIGDGSWRKEYETSVARMNENKVVFWGTRQDIPDLLAASDIFVLPSRYEGTSFALLEAMASSLPAVVTDVGENNRIIKNKINGFLVPPGNSLALAAALKTLAMDQQLRHRLGTAAHTTIQGYSLDQMVEAVSSVYSEVLKG